MSASFFKETVSYYGRHNFVLNHYIREIEKLSRLRPADALALKRQKAMELIRNAAKTPFYRQLYAGIDLNRNFTEVYDSLPQLTKTDLRANALNMLTRPQSLLKKAHTSGTSGSPLTVYRSVRSIIREYAHVWFFRREHGLYLGDRIVSMRGVLDATTFRYFNKAENTLYLSSYLLSSKTIHQYAEQLLHFRPKAIFSFPNTLFALANFLKDAGLQVEVPLIFTSSETLYPFQRERIEKELNGRIFDWYGNAERTIALGQCEMGYYHEAPLYGISEFDEKGAVTTSLINRAFPLIRYFVDDHFTVMPDDCPCGRGRGVISIDGRSEDFVRLPNGTQVVGLGLAFREIPHLRFAQIFQDEISSLRINVVTGADFNVADEELLRHKLNLLLNNSINITFNKVEENEIVKSPSGKYRLVMSTVSSCS